MGILVLLPAVAAIFYLDDPGAALAMPWDFATIAGAALVLALPLISIVLMLASGRRRVTRPGNS